MPLVNWGDTSRTLRLGKKTNTFNQGLEVVEDAHTLTQMLEYTYLGSLEAVPGAFHDNPHLPRIPTQTTSQ